MIVALTIPLAINLGARAKSELESQALLSAQTIAAGIGKEGLVAGPALDRQVKAYAAQVDGRLIVMDRSGEVLSDSDVYGTGDNYANCLRPEVLAALGLVCTADRTIVRTAPTANTIVRYSKDESADLLLAAAPILDEGIVAGAVRITKNIREVTDAVRNVRIGIVVIGLVGLLAGMLIAFALANSLASPLSRLAAAARRIGGGDLSARVGDVGGAREIHDLGESFDEMADRVERTMRAQREFVANASHQLRTPLTGMKLRLESATQAAEDPELRRQLEAADAEVDRLAETVDRMLVMANRIERGDAVAVDLRETAQRAAQRWQTRAEHLGTEVRAPDARGAAALSNDVDLDQIVDNLIDNGLSHGRGPIDIETGRRGDRAFLAVSDHGTGIAETERHKVTERFYRGGRTPGGSGLGLAIARDLAEKWGGSLSVGSSPDGGARIELLLRAVDAVGDAPAERP